GRGITPWDSLLELFVRRRGPVSFHEDESHYSWPRRRSRGGATGLVHGFRRATAGDRFARVYRIQQPRCASGGHTPAHAWTDPAQEPAQCVRKRSVGTYDLE